MASPPLDTGAEKLTETWPLPLAALTFVGESGTVAGVTLLEAVDEAPIPLPLVAFTVKVYVVPFVRPVTVIGLAAADTVFPPGDAVTV
jgi:hypothetical protein